MSFAVLAPLAWVNVCVISQIGIRAALYLDAGFGLLIVVLIFVRKFLVKSFCHSLGGGVIVGLTLSAAYILVTGFRVSDFLLITFAFGVSIIWRIRLKRATGLLFILFGWSLVSINTYYSLRPLSVEPARFQRLRAEVDRINMPLTVALSGGGYRAAVMHAGALNALEEIRYVPDNISAVSGGAIIGAFYAIGGNPEALRDAVIDGSLNLKRELISIPNAVKLLAPLQIPGTNLKLLPWSDFSRTDVQAQLLDRVLFGRREFQELEVDPAQPHLLIGTTNLNDGSAIGISKDAIIEITTLHKPLRFLAPLQDRNVSILENLPRQDYYSSLSFEDSFPAHKNVSDVVAASGAFPGAFRSVKYRTQLKRLSTKSTSDVSFHLADGGISDNSGITLALSASSQAESAKLPYWRTRLLIASDASAAFRETSVDEGDIESMRAIDIIYGRNPVLFPPALYRDLPAVLVLSPRLLLRFPYVKEYGILSGLKSIISEATFDFDRAQLKKLFQVVPGISASFVEGIPMPQEGDEGRLIDERFLAPLNSDISECLSVFIRTGTLTDQLSRSDGEKLFRLGRYLVLLQQTRLSKALDCFSEAKNDPRQVRLCKDRLTNSSLGGYVQSNLRGLPDPDR